MVTCDRVGCRRSSHVACSTKGDDRFPSSDLTWRQGDSGWPMVERGVTLVGSDLRFGVVRDLSWRRTMRGFGVVRLWVFG